MARRLKKSNASSGETFLVGVEIVSLQQQEHTPTGLGADGGLLRIVVSPCQQQARLRPVIGRDQNPAFASIKQRILDKNEPSLPT